jgi:hypothetical protein
MTPIATQAEAKILAVVQERHNILLEQLLASLPELTWNQVFTIVDELSRRGLICLRRHRFEYELRAIAPAVRRPVRERDYALSGSA